MQFSVFAVLFVSCCSRVDAFRPSVTSQQHHGHGLLVRRSQALSFAARVDSGSPSSLPPPASSATSAPLSPVSTPPQRHWLRSSALPLAGICAGLLLAASPSLAAVADASPAVLASAISSFEQLKLQATDSGFLQAFLLIFVSEIGDKTFFIAGLLAAKYGKFISFTGSIGALAVMTVISTVLGQIFHAIPTSLTQGVPYDDIVAVAAFSYFGIKTLLDASKLEDGDNAGIEEEKAEAEEIVEELSQDERRRSVVAKLLQTFTLVFAAEIGDRSFLSTIALSAALNPYAVATGAIAAHASATGVAVAGGVLLSKYLSEKVIGYIGGSLFIVFAVTTALGVF